MKNHIIRVDKSDMGKIHLLMRFSNLFPRNHVNWANLNQI